MDPDKYNIYRIVKDFLGEYYLDSVFSGSLISTSGGIRYMKGTFYIQKDIPNIDLKTLLDLLTTGYGECIDENPENIMSGDHISVTVIFKSVLDSFIRIR